MKVIANHLYFTQSNEYLVLDLNENSDIFVRDGYTYKPFGAHSKPVTMVPMPTITLV